MKYSYWLVVVFGVTFLSSTSSSAATSLDIVEHVIDVQIDPDKRRIELIDNIRFGSSDRSWTILVDAQLDLSLDQNDNDTELDAGAVSASTGLREYSLKTGPSGNAILKVTGNWRADYGEARGQVSTEGIYLPPHSGWMPIVADSRTVFTLKTRLPAGWVSVSQGTGSQEDNTQIWSEPIPQPGVWLVAGRYYLHQVKHRDIQLSAYFFKTDPTLANTYFQAAGDWLDRFSELLGGYPFSKLAVVENFWQSGYGMPSFALLGSKVVSLPFIPHTAWPHEILHNWFGNGVYADQDGNWSEGLTAYLADHEARDLQGLGAQFRRDALNKFSSFIEDGEDIELRDFRFRHDNETAVVGYDKAMMVFHMLRIRTGDRGMVNGLRKFIKDNMHRNASWLDIQSAMSAVTGENLDSFFKQWLNRTGAPELSLKNAAFEEGCVTGTLQQNQDSDPYDLRVPVFASFGNQTIRQNIAMRDREKPFSICAEGQASRISVDPEFDVFRKLYAGEVPASISELIGMTDVVAILPTKAPDNERLAWQRVASEAGITAMDDSAISDLPKKKGIWVLGAANRFASELLLNDNGRAVLGDQTIDVDRDALIIVRRRFDRPIGFASIPPDGDATALMKRVKHYGRYSYLAFSEGDRIAGIRGQWSTIGDSPLTVSKSDRAAPLVLPPREPLTDVASQQPF